MHLLEEVIKMIIILMLLVVFFLAMLYELGLIHLITRN